MERVYTRDHEFNEDTIYFLAIRQQLHDAIPSQNSTIHRVDTTQERGTRSLRKGRYSQRNQIYHITSTTLERAPFLQGYERGRFVVNAFRTEEKCGHARTLAFVIMPDHFHWLMEQGDSSRLSIAVGNVKASSARKINRSLKRTGPLWQSGFYDRAIRRDEDITAVARYIVANPLRAGLVGRIGDYPLWDSVWL